MHKVKHNKIVLNYVPRFNGLLMQLRTTHEAKVESTLHPYIHIYPLSYTKKYTRHYQKTILMCTWFPTGKSSGYYNDRFCSVSLVQAKTCPHRCRSYTLMLFHVMDCRQNFIGNQTVTHLNVNFYCVQLLPDVVTTLSRLATSQTHMYYINKYCAQELADRTTVLSRPVACQTH